MLTLVERSGGLILLSLAAGCGNGTFFEQPWPDSHSALAVWTSLDDRNQRLAQAAPGEALEIELPHEEGRLYVRSYAPQLSIAGQPISECPASLAGEGTLFPGATSHWTTEASRGRPAELLAEGQPPRAFGFRAPGCVLVVDDPCEPIVFEQLPVPPGVSPFTVSRIDDDSFYMAGTDTEQVGRKARLFRYDGDSYQEIFHTSAAAVFMDVHSFADGKLAVFNIPQHDIELITESGSVTPYLGGFELGIAGASNRVFGFTTNRVAELHPDGRTTDLPTPPETLEDAAVYGAGRLAVLGTRDIFTLIDNAWVAAGPPVSLAMHIRIGGGPHRLYQMGGNETLFIQEPNGTWVDETAPGDGTGQFRTATDVSAMTAMAAGDRVLAVRGSAGWCVQEDVRLAYFGSVTLSEGVAIAVSASFDGAAALVTRIRDR